MKNQESQTICVLAQLILFIFKPPQNPIMLYVHGQYTGYIKCRQER